MAEKNGYHEWLGLVIDGYKENRKEQREIEAKAMEGNPYLDEIRRKAEKAEKKDGEE